MAANNVSDRIRTKAKETTKDVSRESISTYGQQTTQKSKHLSITCEGHCYATLVCRFVFQKIVSTSRDFLAATSLGPVPPGAVAVAVLGHI